MSESSRTVVITGAGGALGSALSRRFAADPDTNLVLSDLNQRSLDATLAELPREVPTQLADVSDADQVEAVARLAVERFGRLDVLISNAGVLAPTAASTTSPPPTGSGPFGSTCSAPSTASVPPSR